MLVPAPFSFSSSYSGILSSQIQCRKKKIKYINLPYIKIGNEEIKPRDYQIEAYNKFTGKGILQLPCGMGKTLIACMVATNYDNIIILSPLRNYAVQLLEKFKATKIHSCFIVNEYGTLEGMITLNDILSSILRVILGALLAETCFNVFSACFAGCGPSNSLSDGCSM